MTETIIREPRTIFDPHWDDLWRELITEEMGIDGNEFRDGYTGPFLLRMGEICISDGILDSADHIAQILFERAITPSSYGDQTEAAACFKRLDKALAATLPLS